MRWVPCELALDAKAMGVSFLGFYIWQILIPVCGKDIGCVSVRLRRRWGKKHVIGSSSFLANKTDQLFGKKRAVTKMRVYIPVGVDGCLASDSLSATWTSLNPMLSEC